MSPPHGRLRPCPKRPNCVSSQAPPDDGHHVPPLPAGERPATALDELAALLSGLPRTRLVAREPGYLHAEVRTRWLRFVDDLELLLDEPAGLVHVRSASRVGHSDLGVNRRRVEDLRARWLRRLAGERPSA